MAVVVAPATATFVRFGVGSVCDVAKRPFTVTHVLFASEDQRVSHRVLKLNNGHLSLVHGTTQEATRRGGGRRGILQHTTMAQLNMVC